MTTPHPHTAPDPLHCSICKFALADFPRLADRCPNPDCDRPATHAGYHEDEEGFRWGQQDREDAIGRAIERSLREAFDLDAEPQP